MIVDANSIFTVSMLCAPFLLIFMLLPTLLELKKPKDAGPRLIMAKVSISVLTQEIKINSIIDIEEKCQLDTKLLPLISRAFNVLPDLEV